MYVICFSHNTRFTLYSSDKPRCVHTSSLNVAVSESSTNLIPCYSEGVPKATTLCWVLNNSGIEETLRQKTSTLRRRNMWGCWTAGLDNIFFFKFYPQIEF